MNGGAKTSPEAPRKMAFRERARAGEFPDGDISFKMRAQHLLGSELLPGFQSTPGPGCELWRAAMRLQRMRAEHHPNLVERKPIERLPGLDRGENALCHLRHNQVFDKERFLKTERRR